jgi:hypothetical protein
MASSTEQDDMNEAQRFEMERADAAPGAAGVTVIRETLKTLPPGPGVYRRRRALCRQGAQPAQPGR